MPEHLQFLLNEPSRVSKQNSSTIVAKKIKPQLLLIEEATEYLKTC